MTDIEIIREMGRLLKVPLMKMEPEEIEDNINFKDRGYSIDEKGAITGLRLENLSIKPVLKHIAKLGNVGRLNFCDCRLEKGDIDFLRGMDRLTFLNIRQNKDIEDFSFLRELKGLTSLDLSYNGLTDVSFFGELKGLTQLNLSGNNLTDVSIIGELKGLTSLDLSFNGLIDVSFLQELKGLTSLYLLGNNLTDVSSLRELKRLTSLNLTENNLTDVSFLGELKELTSLALRYNQITDVTILRELRELKWLGLSGNKIKYISSVADLDNLTYLDIFKNPLEIPPKEILEQGLEAIRNYFRSLKQDVAINLDEVKILLVGDGGTGKTSLLKCLNKKPFNEKESQTDGVNIDTINYEIGLNGQQTTIKSHFWDFGGQEIMHASHQFFLSERSLYILVLDSRMDSRKDEKAEYWLQHIQTFGKNSPVMIVMNKSDENPSFDLDRNSLMSKYSNIHGFYKTSCLKGTGIDTFENDLKMAIPKIELLQSPIPASWMKVKEELETVTGKKHYIDHLAFNSICSKDNVDDDSTRNTLIQFLNELGVVLHFKELELENFHVLNPRWVTDAVYKIINSQYLAEHYGILNLRQLDFVLNNEERKTREYGRKLVNASYDHDERCYIVSLMEKFELCYRLSGNCILIPDLLEEKTPLFKIDGGEVLRYIVQYDFLPKNIISRFIVKRHGDIKDNMQWRTGVILEDKGLQTIARITADNTDKKISIIVSGKQKREYFSIIRKTIRDINASFKNLTFKELVPLPDKPTITLEYEKLIGQERMGETHITIGKLGKRYLIKQLLDGIEKESERIDSQKGGDTYHFYGTSPTFIQKEEVIDRSEVSVTSIGNHSTVMGSQLIAGSKIRDIITTVNNSNVPGELKDALKSLSEEVKKIAERMEEDIAEEMVGDMETFTKEALKPIPRKKHLEVSAEGLLDAAKGVGKVAKWGIEQSDKITPLVNLIISALAK